MNAQTPVGVKRPDSLSMGTTVCPEAEPVSPVMVMSVFSRSAAPVMIVTEMTFCPEMAALLCPIALVKKPTTRRGAASSAAFCTASVDMITSPFPESVIAGDACPARGFVSVKEKR